MRDHDGAIYLSTGEEGLVGTKIYMDVVSVGATINVLLASVRAKEKTIIENAAREPEIIDVVNLLNKMGANIKGAGTSIIRVEGVKAYMDVRIPLFQTVLKQELIYRLQQQLVRAFVKT